VAHDARAAYKNVKMLLLLQQVLVTMAEACNVS
jgi:hypothetical protein